MTVDRGKPRRKPSLHRRIWMVTVSVQLLAILTVTGLCLYESYETLVASFRGQARAILRSMGDALEQPGDLSEVKAAVDTLCGGLRDNGYLFYCIWRVDDGSLLMADAKYQDSLPPALRETIAARISQSDHGNLWLDVHGTQRYFARWHLHEGRWGRLIILAAVDVTDHTAEFNEILLVILFGSLAVLVLCAVVTHWLVGYIIRPLAEMSQRLSRTPLEGLSSLELCPDSAPREILPFAAVVQDVIRRLDEQRCREKRFVADVSHDLQTPLALIRSSAELALSRKSDPASWRRSLEEILGDTDRLSAMISRLLELARLDGALRLTDAEAIDLAGLRARVDRECRDLTEGRAGVAWRCNGVETLYGNADMIVRMVVNLVRNALQYGPPDGKVTVSTEALDERVRLRVSDEGGALSSEDITLMMGRFSRLDESRRRHAGGCGLGLSIVTGIVRLHGGELTVESTPASGTTITVSLPRGPVTARP